LGHSEQGKGFSPVCIRICLRNFKGFEKDSVHIEQLNGFAVAGFFLALKIKLDI
jgi:hypothetical protein